MLQGLRFEGKKRLIAIGRREMFLHLTFYNLQSPDHPPQKDGHKLQLNKCELLPYSTLHTKKIPMILSNFTLTDARILKGNEMYSEMPANRI